MGFAKGIAAETHHHVPDGANLFFRDVALAGTGVKAFFIILQLMLPVFFGHDLAQVVGFGMGKAGQGQGRPGHIFLVDHDAEGLFQHLGQQRMDRVPRSAMQAANVLADELIGGRANDAAVDHQVFKIPNPGFLLQQPHGRTFNIKAAHGAALGQGLLGGQIVFRFPVEIIKCDPVGLQVADGIPNDAQTAVAQQIDLDQAGIFGGIFFPLDNGHAFGCPLQGHVFVNRPRGDHHAAGMHGQVAGGADDPLGK